MFRALSKLPALALACLAACAAARADEVEDFYRGATVKVLIGYDTGTGYDVFARALARHLGAYIPGKPQVLPQNMPGAASLTMMNHLYNIAPRDGSVIALPARNLYTEPLFGNDRARYDPARFSMIGNMSRDVALCVAWRGSGVSTFGDVREREILIGATAPNSISTIYPQVLNALLGTRFRIVAGYTDANAISLAMERGEIQGYCGYTIASIKSAHPDWLEKDLAKIFVLLSLERSAQAPGVPTVLELVDDEPARQALTLVFGDLTLGRPVAGPPDIPPARLAALRKAFDETMRDPEFLRDAARTKIDIDPMTGEEAARVLARILAAPAAAVKRVMDIRGQ